MTAEDRYPSYRAPQANREVLCVPSLESVLEQLPSARDAINSSTVLISGVPLPKLAGDARDALLADAKKYTALYADLPTNSSENGPLVITGHQPELVHPGVWLKNFAAARLARDSSGTAISLIIDNDLCRKPSIRVPTGTVDEPQVLEIAFDRSQPEMPYEERMICDSDLWHSFGDRVARALSNLIPDSLINQWWSADTASQNVGQAIAQSRHRQELAWGSQGLEIPQSVICQSTPFQTFALHLLSNATQLRTEYNGALAEYRASHKLRSEAQPLPDLQQHEDWFETPFWVWSTDTPIRKALYALQTRAGLMLSDRSGWEDTLPSMQGDNIGLGLQRLGEWERSGLKIRTRALITTLYARLLLADTFIHGIGGAKYDQVTDRLCERLFGISLPPFLVLSGTLQLPIDHEPVPPTRIASLRQTLRELRYHPELHVSRARLAGTEEAQVEELIAKKRLWVQTPKTNLNASERHAQIESANTMLQPFLQSQRENAERELASAVAQTRTNLLLESREYPFCLFPPEILHDFLLDF